MTQTIRSVNQKRNYTIFPLLTEVEKKSKLLQHCHPRQRCRYGPRGSRHRRTSFKPETHSGPKYDPCRRKCAAQPKRSFVARDDVAPTLRGPSSATLVLLSADKDSGFPHKVDNRNRSLSTENRGVWDETSTTVYFASAQ
jgi:hypothetical protein